MKKIFAIILRFKNWQFVSDYQNCTVVVNLYSDLYMWLLYDILIKSDAGQKMIILIIFKISIFTKEFLNAIKLNGGDAFWSDW